MVTRPGITGMAEQQGPWRVYFPVLTRIGEYASSEDAAKLQQQLGDGAVVVERFSAEEAALLRNSWPKAVPDEH